MRRLFQVLTASMIGAASFGGAWVYGQGNGSSGTTGQQPGVLGPCAAPTGGATGTPGAAPTPAATPGQCITVAIPQGAVGQGPAAFGVNPLQIPVGTQVTWVNNDSVPHTVTSTSGTFDSGPLQPGQSFTFTFSNPGTYDYYCMIHGPASMSGEIQVQAGGASPTGTPGSAGTSGGSGGGY